jgi:hypothetical protein
MKFTALLALVFGGLLVWNIAADIQADNEFNRDVQGYWNLSVRASTLEAKSQYLNQYVAAIENAHLGGYDALIFKRPDNSYDSNIAVLKNLQTRMSEVKGMDVTSFAYQQAISQITAQEQDDARSLLSVFEGIWYLNHHPLLWDWIDGFKFLFLIFVTGTCLLVTAVLAFD